MSMRSRFQFALYTIAATEGVLDPIDPTLSLMGAQGWEIRAMAPGKNGALILALQRPLDEEPPLADSASLTAALEEPLPTPQVMDS